MAQPPPSYLSMERFRAARTSPRELQRSLQSGRGSKPRRPQFRQHSMAWDSSQRTGLCYDVRMRYHATVDEGDMHPEDPRRIYFIYRALAESGLVDDEDADSGPKSATILAKFKAREVKKEEACLVHSEGHWDFIESTAKMSLQDLQEHTRQGDSVYFNNESFFCGKLSCGGAIEACRHVLDGTLKNAIAVIRPPGHHAEPCHAMGFCLFNNVAVATKVMLKNYPEICKKILILDWDVHHGNGTQSAFYDNPNVLYMSIHRYGGGTFYPPGDAGNLDKCGEREGRGKNVNIPWASGAMGDGDYIYAFNRVIMPIAMEFNPDLVIVSAGFDAAAGDNIGGCFVTPAGFAQMTALLKTLANGKIVVCLEGGYNLLSIAHSALAVTKVLIGEPPGPPTSTVPSNSAKDTIHQVIIQQSRFWDCMSIKGVLPDLITHRPARIHDVIRLFQAKELADKHSMYELPVMRNKERTSKSFEDQVLASPDYQNKETLVFIVHDPPQVVAPSGSPPFIDIHEAMLLDSGSSYIDWAISNGFGVIDANVPQHLTGIDDPHDVNAHAQQLCAYLWDNYIELSDAKNVIAIGIGRAAGGITHLLGAKAVECRKLISGVVNFYGDVDLRAVQAPVHGDGLVDWYFDNSIVYCSKDHNVWMQRKLRKKWGGLRKTNGTCISEILRDEFGPVTTWLGEKLKDRLS
ncbi:putative catalytic subunit of a class II histone deacetylase complex [Peziza echinospora]|nr:putative catalytic subunit of a class II histone deacetylase complex [Peziza echinospora]